MEYGYKKEIDLPYEKAVEKTKEDCCKEDNYEHKNIVKTHKGNHNHE